MKTGQVMGALAALSGLLLLMSVIEARAEAVRPNDDAQVLLSLTPARAAALERMRQTSAALQEHPQDIDMAIAVAREAIEQGRENADPRAYGQAQAALANWWSETAPPREVQLLRAVVRQAFHDFPGATSDLDAVLVSYPNDAQARLTRAFVRMVTGDDDGAREDCYALPPTVGILASQLCRARVEFLTGEGHRASVRLQRVLTLSGNGQPELRRLALALMAEIDDARGERGNAERSYQAALAIATPEAALLAAYADHLLNAGRPGEVLPLVEGRTDTDILLLRAAIAARETSDPRVRLWSGILRERFAAAKASGNRVHLREEARFQLEVEGNPQAALPLALENWVVQKEPADLRLLVAAALAAGQPTASEAAVEAMRQKGFVDSRIAGLAQ